jgi:hypothetical protein
VVGISVATVEVAADKDRADLTIRFADELPGPFNMPLTVRATATQGDRAVVGESKIEVQRNDER